jgi:hypothetical protein
MGSETDVYLLRRDGEWERPTPAGQAVADAVADATDLDRGELDELDSYVDPADLRALVAAGDGTLTFTVEGREVTVDGAGDIRVS